MALHRQTTLSKQTSQMFQMTIDEFQNSLGGSGKLGSLNLEEFINTVWDQQQSTGPSISPDSMYQQDATVHTPSLPSQYSSQSSVDYSGKTVEEVWQAIQAGKAGGGGKPMEAVTLGTFLQSVGVEMPAYVSNDYHAVNNLGHMQHEKVHPMMAQATNSHILPQHSAAMANHSLRMEDLSQSPLGQRGYAQREAQPPLFERPQPQAEQQQPQQNLPRLYAPAEVPGVVLERPPGLEGVGLPQRGYPTAAVLERPGLLGIAKLEAGPAGGMGRGYTNGAVQSTVLERPGLTGLPKQQGGRGYPAGEVHATATIQMGPGWGGGGAKDRGGVKAGGGAPKAGGGRKDGGGLPPLGKRKKSVNFAEGSNEGSGEMPDIEDPTGDTPPRGGRQRRRKIDPEEVDDRTARQQKRMVKNRESAARSRARKQEYTAQLEVRVAQLEEQNRRLLEKVVRQCPPTPAKGGKTPGGNGLRRTRTVPTPELKRALSSEGLC